MNAEGASSGNERSLIAGGPDREDGEDRDERHDEHELGADEIVRLLAHRTRRAARGGSPEMRRRA